MGLTPEQVTGISGNILKAQADIAELEEYITNQKAKLAENLELGEQLVGDFKITTYVHKAFNAGLAEKVLPHERWLAISKPSRTTTAAMAKKILTEDEFASTQKVSENGVSVKVELRED